MAYYYVKNGGTAVGDAGRYASQQTGSFATLGAANYYNDIADAFAATTTPIAGDFINPSDLHSIVNAAAQIWTGTTPIPVYIIAVSDVNIDASRRVGNYATEQATVGNSSFNIRGVVLSGVELLPYRNIVVAQTNSLMDCRLNSNANYSALSVSGTDGDALTATGCSLVFASVTSRALFVAAGTATLTDITTVNNVNNFATGFTAGGAVLTVKGSDLSSVTQTLLYDVGGSEAADDSITVHFDMCKIATGVAFTNETFKSYNQRALFTRCSDSSVAAEYQYHLHAFGGDVDDDSAIFRNEDEAFTESNQKISYKIVTNSDASLGSPLWLDFPVLRYSKLATLATDTLRFYLTSNTALTDKDIYIEVSYPDGTNKQTPNFISSAPTTVGGTLDLMATGTTLTTDGTSTWTSGLTNKYQIDVSTAADAGADCQPIVKVYVTLPSVTIQIASEFGLN